MRPHFQGKTVLVIGGTGTIGRRIVEPGEFELQVGASSADIRLRATVTVVGETQVLGREWRMESRCVVEH